MIFDHVTPQEMQAARVVTGAAMVGLLAAPIFGRRAGQFRIAVAGLYIACVIGFAIRYLL